MTAANPLKEQVQVNLLADHIIRIALDFLFHSELIELLEQHPHAWFSKMYPIRIEQQSSGESLLMSRDFYIADM